jgi:hypothetical protein
MMPDHGALIAKLKAWDRPDFHKDRQLSDAVLIADGWLCHPDSGYAGNYRWERKTGTATFTVAADNAPHPVCDLNAAIHVLPLGSKFNIAGVIGGGSLTVECDVGRDAKVTHYASTHRSLNIAILLCAVQALQDGPATLPQRKD